MVTGPEEQGRNIEALSNVPEVDFLLRLKRSLVDSEWLVTAGASPEQLQVLDPLKLYLEGISSTAMSEILFSKYSLDNLIDPMQIKPKKNSELEQSLSISHETVRSSVKNLIQTAIILNPGMFLDTCSAFSEKEKNIANSKKFTNRYSMDLERGEDGLISPDNDAARQVDGLVRCARERQFIENNLESITEWIYKLYPDKNPDEISTYVNAYYRLGEFRFNSPTYLRTGVLDWSTYSQPDRDTITHHVEIARALGEYLETGEMGSFVWTNSVGETTVGYRKAKPAFYLSKRIVEYQEAKKILAIVEDARQSNIVNSLQSEFLISTTLAKLKYWNMSGAIDAFNEKYSGKGVVYTWNTRDDLVRQLLDGYSAFESLKRVRLVEDLHGFLHDPSLQDNFFERLSDMLVEYHISDYQGKNVYDEAHNTGMLYDLNPCDIDNIRRLTHRAAFGIGIKQEGAVMSPHVNRGDLTEVEIYDVLRNGSVSEVDPRFGRRVLLDIVERMADPAVVNQLAVLAEELTEEYGFFINIQMLNSIRKLVTEFIARKEEGFFKE